MTLQLRKKIKKLADTFRFPYVYTHHGLVDNRSVRFHINNYVEKFRLKNFGGEREQLTELLDILKDDDIFFDIGASVGAWSVPAAMKVAKGKVFSFEPDPENLERLKRNFELNQLTNFKVIPFAIGDKPGEIELFTAGAYAPSPSLRPVNNISNSIRVKMTTIDELLAQAEIPCPDVIKIDIEGAEMIALRGMSDLLSGSRKPRMLILELHPVYLPAFDTDITDIFEFLIEKKYRIGKLASREDQVICNWHTSL